MAFGLRKSTPTAPSPPAPHLVLVNPRQFDSMEKYEQVASAIGFVSPALAREKLVRWMKDQSHPCWYTGRVNTFLAQQGRGGGKAQWRPLRATDGWVGLSTWRYPQDSDLPDVHFKEKPYSGAVPLFVLELVQQIEEAFAGTYDFHVGDYDQYAVEGEADPFLMAVAKGQIQEGLVIAHWDEPGFDVPPIS